MSVDEFIDDVVEEMDNQEPGTEKEPQEKKPMSKADKRKMTSRMNAEKARKAKLDKLHRSKHSQQYEIYSESDSESDEESPIRIKKNKKKQNGSGKLEDDIRELKGIVSQLARRKVHKPQKYKKQPTVIQITPPAQASNSNTSLKDLMAQKLLLNI